MTRTLFALPLLACTLLLLLASVSAAPSETKVDPAKLLPNVEAPQKAPANISDFIEELATKLNTIYFDVEEKTKIQAPWHKRWQESLHHIQEIRTKATTLSEEFINKRDLLLYVTNAERNFGQLLPSMNRYKNWATLMEAVMSQLYGIEHDLKRELAPLFRNHSQVENLFNSTQSLLSFTITIKRDNKEYQIYNTSIQETLKLLERILTQQKTDLGPANHLLEQITAKQKDIRNNLPKLWNNYYLQKPLAWLDASLWSNMHRSVEIFLTGLQMRRGLELPSDSNGWRRMLVRGGIALVIFSIALFFLRRQSWLPTDTNPAVDHMFKVSLPIISVGFSLLIGSISPNGESYRFFMAIGNIFLIFGQMLLAWDLRTISNPDIARQTPPLLRLFPLTFGAYVLLYLPLIPVLLLCLWLAFVVCVLLWRMSWPELSIGNLHFEKNIRSIDGLVLWICVILTLVGLPILSMIVYLCCVSVLLSTQLCLGGLDRFNYLNENQPQEGIKAIFSNIVVSLATPIIMVLAISSVLIWVATLPGGMVLMQEYLFKNVSVGEAEFNLIHLLVIFTAFFLAKAIVVSGCRYLSKFITNRKNSVDTTLVTPAQTAFTYSVWILFALFVMHILDIDLKNAAMVLTGLSVGIGMGLQSIVNNFFSGLLLIFGRMLQVGDVVEVGGGVTGKVARISVRDTLIQTYDNAFIYVPNSEFISGRLINWSRNDSSVRASVSVGVAYGSDTDLVIKLLRTVVSKQDNILRYPEPTVAFLQFGDNSLDFAVYFWVRTFDERARTCTEVRLQIEKIFAMHNIEIAYPQLDIHMKEQTMLPLLQRSKNSTRKRTRVRPIHSGGVSLRKKPL
ncbi:MAG: mechanosensitive ion channel [Desulfovibrio sp.]|nr:mechanosensitive ion channel [Desulfovibrio sp.]